MRVAGVILAGGRSSRMGGGDKFLLDLEGRPLIGHVLDRLAPQVSAVAISANCDAALLPPGHPVLPDRPPSRGPLSGLLAGMEWAAGLAGVTHLATAAADTPFLPSDLVERLARAAGRRGVALAAAGGRVHPTFGLWPVALRGELAGFLEAGASGRMRDFAAAHGAATADFGPDGEDPFFNVNEPGDLEVARLRARTR